jgi:hypothetical protein
MIREQWLRIPAVVRMLLVVGSLLLVYALLSSFLPLGVGFILALAILVLGLAYAGWEWGLIRSQKAELEAELRRERHDWQQGLPAHLRPKDEAIKPDSPAVGETPPDRPEEGTLS